MPSVEHAPSPSPEWPAPRASFLRSAPFWAAVVMTLANVAKPLHVDDTAHYYYARQIARDPLRPYNFEVFWGQDPLPAIDLMVPPVMPSWWALGLPMLGEVPWAWKAWFFPACLILMTALHAVFRRFARGLEGPLVWLTATSPAILPGLNLMLDVPMLALNVASLATFFRAVDRRSPALAVAAGVVAGLSAQTKYSGFAAPAVIVLYSVVFGRVRLGALAGLTAALVFGSIEGLITLVHGRSLLLSNIGRQVEGSSTKSQILVMVLPLLGALAPAVAMLGLAGLRASRKWVVLPGALALGAIALSGVVAGMADPGKLEWRFWRVMGMLVVAIAAAASWMLLRGGDAEAEADPESEGGGAAGRRVRAVDVFLVAWLALEFVAYVGLSTFPAARRVMGLVVAMTALNGALASRAVRAGAARGAMPWVLGFGLALGGVYASVDFIEALTDRQAVAESARRIRGLEPGAKVWYVGHWGFQYYAERAGFEAVAPGRSRLAAGDWLVMPDAGIDQQAIRPGGDEVELIQALSLGRDLPCRTLSSAYYNGPVPIRATRAPWITVKLYKALKDFTPAAPPKPGGPPTAAGAGAGGTP